MIESPNWFLTISQPKIIQIRVKHSPEILVQAELDDLTTVQTPDHNRRLEILNLILGEKKSYLV